jgi:hypothetical protein
MSASPFTQEPDPGGPAKRPLTRHHLRSPTTADDEAPGLGTRGVVWEGPELVPR